MIFILHVNVNVYIYSMIWANLNTEFTMVESVRANPRLVDGDVKIDIIITII